jgi:holo-[acyl-carrier protein] synthase
VSGAGLDAGRGVGLDLLQIERRGRPRARHPRLAGRLFTDGELAYSRSRARPGQHLAARFCAKEAVTKALGLAVMAPHEVEVLGGGASVDLRLHGAAHARAAQLGVQVAISLTHSQGLAGAVAVLR